MKKKRNMLGNLENALRIIISKPRKLAASVIIDTLFFFVSGMVLFPILSRLIDHAVIIGSAVSENAPSLIRQGTGISSFIFSDPSVSPYAWKFIILALISAFVAYTLYVSFQSIAWKTAFSATGKDAETWRFVRDFAIVNIFWFALFIVQNIISLYSSIVSESAETFSIEKPVFIPFLSTFFLIAIFYFAVISYTSEGNAYSRIVQSFSKGIKKYYVFVPAFIIVFAGYIVLDYLLKIAGAFDIRLMIVAGILTMIPGIAIARVYFILNDTK